MDRGIAVKESIDKMELQEKLQLYLEECLLYYAEQAYGAVN